ncbi:hypothetical protein [Actinomadura madurae]|uniref:LPXTG-motif cell wall anchor domain-containing protein n=1 Tax=Actinomadura madurae TaxID=1993 RepID=A0A1I5FJB6_9ACTN|nr:hypothetical protein [Actinomadura madurae]MCP9952423.1 hypothetical protein [Actinomadura madurae]MCP9969181.1 hypothetical protein [Actinomadura madurae]MCP9981660.1 hypothetical protein [Actinomadura madurae]MCQ0006833.1 hypothetical protein [Actinomadura madurae]MCQ0017859.1 hypothetical protein [Actinomadura madurae]
MRATRLAAAAIAAGSLVLGMAGPALATAPPKDGQFCKKEDLGKTAKAADGTLLKCMKKAGDKQPHWYQISGEPTESPSPSPTKPTFKFGYDKVKLSSRRVAPGLSTTFTVTCPSTVTITGNGYTRNPLPVKKAGKATWTATGTFRSKLPDPTTATVVCKGFGSVRFSTSPEKGGNNMEPKTPKIPTGPINTGDGSMYAGSDGSAAPVLAAMWGALMAAGLGAVALRRRTVRERS